MGPSSHCHRNQRLCGVLLSYHLSAISCYCGGRLNKLDSGSGGTCCKSANNYSRKDLPGHHFKSDSLDQMLQLTIDTVFNPHNQSTINESQKYSRRAGDLL